MAFEEIKRERGIDEANSEKIKKVETDLALEKSAKKKLESDLDRRVKEAETQIEADWKPKVDDTVARADDAEKKVVGLEESIENLKKQLEDRKEAEAVIADFKESKAYDEALSNAAAAEVIRCWTIAEKHIKTNPVANLNSIIDVYVEVKNNLASGRGEPEPYDGPSPSFIAPANPDPPAN